VFSPQVNNLPNRVLRRCLEYLALASLKYVNRNEVLGRLEYFGQIPSLRVSAEELTELEHQLEAGRFPASRYYYLPALNLALLILRGTGLSLGDDHDVTFKPILINTATMFEKYVRVICQEAVQRYDAHVEDGKQSPLPFYEESPVPVNVQPDILVRRGGSTLLVVDVKYKFAPTAQDHYQMWAYMHAHQVTRGGFVNVADMGIGGAKNPAWFRRDQYDVFEYAFDCHQIKTAELALTAMMARQLESALT
jgi:5-methylcytosine-specific restriction endonuclease McrBC regulatory subunit McrC